MAKRGPGRPRNDEYDEAGKLRDPEEIMRDIPEDEPEDEPDEVPNIEAAASANTDMQALRAELAELRKQVEQNTPRKQAPDGVWRHNPRAPHMLVHGGPEVEHHEWGPGKGRPLPPSAIPMYEAVGGGTTNTLEQQYRFLPEFDELGHVKTDEKGEEVGKHIPVGKAAKRDAEGNPVLTTEYKVWLHVKNRGDRLGSNVMSDIAAGKGIPKDAKLSKEIEFDAAGIPVTVE